MRIAVSGLAYRPKLMHRFKPNISLIANKHWELLIVHGSWHRERSLLYTIGLFNCTCTDLVVVIASVAVLAIGSNGQVFATSAIRSVMNNFIHLDGSKQKKRKRTNKHKQTNITNKIRIQPHI